MINVSMNEKIIGYALLAIGLVIITFAGVNVYQVFTHRILPVQLFSFQGISLDAGQLFDPGTKQQASLQLISPEMINQTSNVFAHLFLMGFVASIGFKIANLGVGLLRPLEVKLRTKETSQSK